MVLSVALALLAPLALGDSSLDETHMTLRQQMLQLVNRERALYNLRPVELDVDASRLADRYCEQQIRNRTSGHFTIDGLAPYMRYSLSGGNDGVSENAAAWSASYRFTDRDLLQMLRRSHDAMMGEVPPHDGHRRTILDPYATNVGIGLAWEGGEFRIAQEFVRHYLAWSRPFPRGATAGDQIIGTAKPIDGFRVEAVSVHHERLPQPIARARANAIESYRLPDRRRDYLPRLRTYYQRDHDGTLQLIREEYSNGRRGDFPVSIDGSFTISVPLVDGPGMYTIVVWVRNEDGSGDPIAASNVSIRVDAPATGSSVLGGTQ